MAIAEAGRRGEVRYLCEVDTSEVATRRLVAGLAARYRKLTFCYEAAADVLALVKTWPGSVEQDAPSACRPVLTSASRDGDVERQVGAEGWSPIEQRGGAGGHRDQSARPDHPLRTARRPIKAL